MTTKRPRLYPRHQHEWVDAEIADPMKQNRQIVRCTVCGFTVPRNLANLDGVDTPTPLRDEPDYVHIQRLGPPFAPPLDGTPAPSPPSNGDRCEDETCDHFAYSHLLDVCFYSGYCECGGLLWQGRRWHIPLTGQPEPAKAQP